MSQEPTCFELCLPGILAALILAAVVLAIGESVFPDAFQQIFPRQTFVVLPISIGAASVAGVMGLLFTPQGTKKNSGSTFRQTIRKTRMTFR